MPAYNSVGLFHSRFVHLIISMQNRDIFFFFPSPSFPVRGRRIVIRRGVTRSYSSPLLSSPPPSPLGIARGGKLNNISSNIYASVFQFQTWSNRSLRNLPRMYRIGRFRNNSTLGTRWEGEGWWRRRRRRRRKRYTV